MATDTSSSFMHAATLPQIDEPPPPSRQQLLERAAQLGPARRTWESFFVQPHDPILDEKMQPHVAERRARFRKLVKATLGACIGCCVLALIVSAASDSPRATAASRIKLTPATAVVPIEPLDQAVRGKAVSTRDRRAPAVAAVRPAKKPAKRR